MAKKGKKPNPVQVIVRHAHRFGLDPAAVVAYMLEESGGRWDALGDHGTSFGPFQMHRGGALGSHSGAWAESPAGLIAGMRMMAQGGARGLKGEAAVRAIYSGFGKGTPLAVPKGIAQYGNAQRQVNSVAQTPQNTQMPVKGSVSPPNATPPLSGGLTPLNYTVPSLGPVSGPMGKVPVDAGNFGKVGDFQQVDFVPPQIEPVIQKVVPHKNGKPWHPTPQQTQQEVGGVVRNGWKYPKMITGVPSKFSNTTFAGHADMVHVDTSLLLKINQIGRILGVKINVISGYRSPKYSAGVGGYANDPHARGVAVDAYINGRPIGDYPGAVALMKRLGLETGATPNFYRGNRDPEHVQIPGSGIDKSKHAKHTMR